MICFKGKEKKQLDQEKKHGFKLLCLKQKAVKSIKTSGKLSIISYQGQ